MASPAWSRADDFDLALPPRQVMEAAVDLKTID
jgi:hypothetical protein